mgnify:CR=1 FL=1
MLDHLTYTAPEPKVIAGAKGDWELVIGLEVHAQVASNAKLFSGASTTFGAEPNSNVSFVDAAMPGMLPVINEFCVAQAVRTGLGLKAQINLASTFDRKNYFYPDLPQGYQISQLYHPIVGEGEIIVDMGPGVARRVRIERIHLEQDAGKSIHDMDPALSFVDLNRTGVALMEIVSRPDIRGPEEAAAYVAKLRQIMRYLGTCDGNMQNGNLRADVNVSVCKPGDYERFMETGDFGVLGTRCEIKNMNSLRFIQAAIDFEARRQIAILEDGGKIVQETRLYDPDRGETRSMRSKEEAHDYRYFPDPDLLPLEIEQGWVDAIAAAMPELPDEKRVLGATGPREDAQAAGVRVGDDGCRAGRPAELVGSEDHALVDADAVEALRGDGGEACVGGDQCDAVAVAGLAPDGFALAQVGINLLQQALGEHRADHLGGGAAAQAIGQRQGDAVLALCGGAEDDCLGIGNLRHGVVSVFGPASCGAFYDPEPRRARGGSSGSAGDQRACSPSPKALSVMRFRRLA